MVLKKGAQIFFDLFLKAVSQVSIGDSFFEENVHLRFQ